MSGRGIAATIADVDAASDESSLRAGVDGAYAAVAAELRVHTPAVALAGAWSEVLQHTVASAARLIDQDGELPWAWFVSGSVARGEAAPGSDVETMIAIGDQVGDDGKIALLARAADVHALLERCGVLGDANGVLASRPRFCRRRASWSEGVERWSADPREDRGVVMTGLLTDSRGVLSASAPEDLLRAQTVAAAGRNAAVRQAMLQDATAFRATFPSRLRWFANQADHVDLKLVAMDPVVKIARWAALSAGSDALYTPDRLDAAAAANILDADDVSSLRDCFSWLLRFRWRIRADGWLREERVSDVISLSQTAPQERAMLRSVAREVTGIGRKLTFLASTQSFH